jgi:hypothetical protein
MNRPPFASAHRDERRRQARPRAILQKALADCHAHQGTDTCIDPSAGQRPLTAQARMMACEERICPAPK